MAKKKRRAIDRTMVAQLGQPVLHQPAREVSLDEIQSEAFQAFVDHMHAVLEQAGGVGLAAPQVFDGRRVFLAAVLPNAEGSALVETFINPVILERSEETSIRWEGCLSFMELMVRVSRHVSLTVQYVNRNGESKGLRLRGFPARVIQHEYDHLDGILTLDRAGSSRDIMKSSEYDELIDD